MSKYSPLWQFLKNEGNETYQLSFEEIKEILGFEINHSFLTHKKEAKDFGFEIEKISLKQKTVKIRKIKGL